MNRQDQPAFPLVFSHKGEDKLFTGVTIREHFAGLAMQGLLAHPHTDANPEAVASDAVDYADALIEELAKPRETPLDESGHPVKP